MYKAVTLAGGIREPLLTCSSQKSDDDDDDLLAYFYFWQICDF